MFTPYSPDLPGSERVRILQRSQCCSQVCYHNIILVTGVALLRSMVDNMIITDAPELLAAGQWVWRLPRPPSLPRGACPKLAIACASSIR